MGYFVQENKNEHKNLAIKIISYIIGFFLTALVLGIYFNLKEIDTNSFNFTTQSILTGKEHFRFIDIIKNIILNGFVMLYIWYIWGSAIYFIIRGKANKGDEKVVGLVNKLEDKLRKRKEQKNTQQQINKELIETEKKRNKLGDEFRKMLYAPDKIKIIEGTKEEVEKEYEDFMIFINKDRGCGRLGSLSSLKDPEFISNGNITKIIIRYSVYELKEDIRLEDYEKVINEFDEMQEKIKEYRKK